MECVREHGFDATSHEGFGVSITAAADAQLEAASQVEGECWGEVERRFPAPPPLSPEEQHEYMAGIADCLRALGYVIPEPPTLEAYIDQAYGDAPPENLWDPYHIVAEQGADVWELQRESCPPYAWAR